MRPFVLVLVACAGNALAQQSYLSNEVSTDGGVSWSSSADVLPGATVQVRVRCRFIGTNPVIGLAIVAHQPTLSNWRADLGDQHNPFTFPGLSMGSPFIGAPTTETSYQGRPVTNVPQNTGRMFPFGWANQDDDSRSGLLRSFNDAGNILRFSGARLVTNPLGNLAWGVVSDQPSANESGTHFSTSRNVTVFKYSITLSSDSTPRKLVADVPLANISGDFVNSLSRWYLSTDGSPILSVVMSPSLTASINVVPAPSVAMILIIGTALSGRRRSRDRRD